MKVISNKDDLKDLKKMDLDPMILGNAMRVIVILNEYYGENRDFMTEDGGYILLIESPEDLKQIPVHTGCTSLQDHIFEYVDQYDWGYDSLYFKGSEFGINIVFLNDSLLDENKRILSKEANETQLPQSAL